MSQSSSQVAQVRIDALPACYQAILEALTLADMTAAELDDTFRHYVAAECLQCGTRVTGEELGQIALAIDTTPDANAKIARLRNGYCVREGCDSYYYRLVFIDHPKIDWGKLAAGLAQTGAAPPAPTLPPKRYGAASLWLEDRRTRWVLAGIGILLALLVARHFFTGGRIPFLHQKPAYVVDPASAPPAHRTNP